MAEKAEEEPTKFDIAFGELLTAIDRNYDNSVSLTELDKVFPDSAQVFFSEVDLDKDGKISVEELRKVFVLADGTEDLDRVEKLTVKVQKGLEELFFTEFWKLVSLLDKNYDDNISLEEFAAMYPDATKAFFNDLDKDHNDQLNAEEFQEMFVLADETYDINRVCEIASSIRKSMMDVFNAEFKKLLILVDKNEDKRISLNEFAAMYPGATKGMFNSLDVNHDKELSIPEFKKLFKNADATYDTPRVKELCEKMTVENKEMFQEELLKLMSLLDKNYDNQISMDEFKTIYPDAAAMFFGFIDENDDKQLSVEELTEFFTNDDHFDTPRVKELIKQVRDAMEKEFDDSLNALIALVDENADDMVSLAEFSAAYPVQTKSFFGELDTNNDNQLQRKELRNMFVLADGTLDIARCKEMQQEVIQKQKA